ncbi:MAG: Rpn family recombination-promoting nuclease/putative transposase, partial [Candidatus Desantisbacteria bacterium]
TLEPIIALTITDFIMFENVHKVITYFNLIEKDLLIKYNDEIELIFIELPKFKKEENDLTSITDKWIYFIKNAGNLEYTPKTLTSESPIEKAFEIANTANMSREELDVQWKQHDFILCQKGSIELALKQGRKEGIKKGKKEGIEQGIKHGKIEVAKILLSLGDNIERVSKATGLTTDEIEKIK